VSYGCCTQPGHKNDLGITMHIDQIIFSRQDSIRLNVRSQSAPKQNEAHCGRRYILPHGFPYLSEPRFSSDCLTTLRLGFNALCFPLALSHVRMLSTVSPLKALKVVALCFPVAHGPVKSEQETERRSWPSVFSTIRIIRIAWHLPIQDFFLNTN
jgi:hypothetical protein